MADLQSFFAKKDKKKKSKKPETFTPDDLMKKIEQDDEEWNEFETDKEIDLSTLKIQNLGEKEKERQEENDQESLKKAVEESKSTMKWNIPQGESSEEDEDNLPEEEIHKAKNEAAGEANGIAGEKDAQQPAATDASEIKSTSTSNEGKYIAPALRRDGPPLGAFGPSLAPMSMKRTGHQNKNLDVNSIDQFPSLGATVQTAGGAWGSGSGVAGQDGAGAFTSVRKGARGPTEGPDQSGLSTSNKFSMLKGQNRT
ncbi:hypothetical protein BIW11_13175 [Tropilaelaps mercedesae]|uniref:Protein CDV3-like n=1 Tax=Tropilaelaps mercedesae TaxID=418985 RepID=A0A1V9X3E6_9ACAR|nr:hypothetical protein BIW11_13175 [Tropilaelaps mercedesae]